MIYVINKWREDHILMSLCVDIMNQNLTKLLCETLVWNTKCEGPKWIKGYVDATFGNQYKKNKTGKKQVQTLFRDELNV